jgi:hypothetical protein
MQKEIFEQPQAVAATIPDAGLFDPAAFGSTRRARSSRSTTC